MKSIKTQITVLKDYGLGRAARFGIFYESRPRVLLDLNFMDYEHTILFLSKIKELQIDGGYLEWETEETIFEFYPNEVVIKNESFENSQHCVDISEVIELLEKRKDFMENWTVGKFKHFILDGYKKVKKNPKKYRMNEKPFNVDFYECSMNESVKIMYILLKKDFKLSENEFIKSLKVHPSFFKFQDV